MSRSHIGSSFRRQINGSWYSVRSLTKWLREVVISSFDVKKRMKERRLKEGAEKIHGKPQFSAPPSVFRSSWPHSAQSRVHEFGDAESIRVRSEADLDDWYRDEVRHSPTQKERQGQYLILPDLYILSKSSGIVRRLSMSLYVFLCHSHENRQVVIRTKIGRCVRRYTR